MGLEGHAAVGLPQTRNQFAGPSILSVYLMLRHISHSGSRSISEYPASGSSGMFLDTPNVFLEITDRTSLHGVSIYKVGPPG